MIDEDMLRKIVRESTKEAVHETLISLGFNPEEPQEMQANLIYLDKIRRGSEFLSIRIKASVIAVTIPTFLYLLWEVVKNAITK